MDDLEGVTYAVPNKEKRKTRLSSALSLLSRAEFEASTEALLQSISDHDKDMLYESVDPVPPSNLDGSSNILLDHDTTYSGTDQPIATTSDDK